MKAFPLLLSVLVLIEGCDKNYAASTISALTPPMDGLAFHI